MSTAPKVTGETRRCARPGCGESFEVLTTRRKQRFCSRRCSALARSPSETRACERCGKRRRVPRNLLARGKGRYCSKACFDAAQRDAAIESDTRAAYTCTDCGATFWGPRSRPRRRCDACRAARVGSRSVTCAVCGKPHRVYASQAKKGRGAICSSTCLRAAQAAKRPTITCAFADCGERFEVSPSDAKRQFCSHACRWGKPKKRKPGKPKTFRCERCKTKFSIPAWQRDRRFCTSACFYKARVRRKRTPDRAILERNERILALHRNRMRAPQILETLMRERPDWGGLMPATIRQVIYLAKRQS